MIDPEQRAGEPVKYSTLPFDMRQQEVHDAMRRAREQLAEVLAQGGEITRVTDSLRLMREKNHYGERMELALTQQRKRKPTK